MTSDKGQLDFENASGEEVAPAKRAPKRPRAKKAAEQPRPEALAEDDCPSTDLSETVTRSEALATPEPVLIDTVPEIDLAAAADPQPDIEVAESVPDRPPHTSDSAVEPEPSPPRAAESSGDRSTTRLFFLTNRMNLNGLLSSRVLAPRESFLKYYRDLLDLTPGWIPLLVAPPPASLIEQVVAEPGSGTPVLVELQAAALAGQPFTAPVTYVPAAALSDVTAIHFPDTKSLREHRARAYSNVHPHDELLHVSPELFNDSSASTVTVESPPDPAIVDWHNIDRVRGAISAALAACRTGESLAVVSGLLGVRDLPADTILPNWLTWGGLTGEWQAPATDTDPELADRLIFETAYRLLGEQDQVEAWSPTRVLDLIENRISAMAPPAEAQAIIERNLKHVRELVSIERDFEPFRNPSSPYVAVKSLLLVLLRPELETLLAWPTHETGADDTTFVVAAVLAGRLRGLARESVSFRTAELDDLTAAWAVRAARRRLSTLGDAEFVTDEDKTALLIEGATLRTSEPLVPDPVPIYEALDTDARLRARVGVSGRLGWAVQFRIVVPPGSDVVSDGSVITITATDRPIVETVVGEEAFLDRLRGARTDARADVVRILRAILSPGAVD